MRHIQRLKERLEHHSHDTRMGTWPTYTLQTQIRRLLLTIVVKDHKEMYDKTNEQFKDKAKKECLWKRFTISCKLSVKVCKTWFELQRTSCSKLMQLNFEQALKEMWKWQNWIQDKVGFLSLYTILKGYQASSPRPKEPVHQLLKHMVSPEVQLTWTVGRSVFGQQTPHYQLHESPAPIKLQGILQSTRRSWTNSHRCKPC